MLSATPAGGGGQGGFQFRLEFSPGDFLEAERQRVVIGDLGIEQGVTPGCEAFEQPGQAGLAGLADAGKHAFASEQAAQRDAVETADQFAF